HPFWAVDYADAVTETLWDAWQQAGSATAAVSLLLTGHIHLLETISFTDNGGTALDPPPTVTPNMNIGGRIIKNFMPYDQFGFITATPSPTGWTLDIRDTMGQSKTKCGVTATSLVCD